MKRTQISHSIFLIMLCLAVLVPFGSTVQAKDVVVRAVLFYSPFCPHCHEVMEKDLPPLESKYGEQLDIVEIDVTQEAGQKLYQTAVKELGISEDHLGVPTLVVGSQILVGSMEIPQLFPGIIENGLSSGGVTWPKITGLEAFLPAGALEEANLPLSQDPVSGTTWIDRFLHDPLANSLAVVVLLIMIVSVIAVGYAYVMEASFISKKWPLWLIPTLAVIGLGVSLYLSYVEIGQRQAICGPVGDCNAVQSSPYARLFGFLHVGVLGAIGYIAILGVFLIQRYGPAYIQKFSALAMWGMAWFGILFAIYLTFLEPFVIGATCMWCLTNSIVMTLIFWASTPEATAALQREDDLLSDEQPA